MCNNHFQVVAIDRRPPPHILQQTPNPVSLDRADAIIQASLYYKRWATSAHGMQPRLEFIQATFKLILFAFQNPAMSKEVAEVVEAIARWHYEVSLASLPTLTHSIGGRNHQHYPRSEQMLVFVDGERLLHLTIFKLFPI